MEDTDDPRPRPGGSSGAAVSRPAHLEGDLAGELEHLVVQQEEARQPELGDEAQLLLQARGGLDAQPRAHRVARVEAPVADLGQRAIGARVLRAGVAVAEVAGEVEAQGGGQALGLGDRLGMVGEARGHGLRRGEDVGVVAAAQRLGGVERGVLADGHEGVLQPRALGRVGMDVARGHAGDAEAGASAARPRLSARSWRWNGRCSSTRKASRPKARSSRRMVGSSRTPWRAQPLRQTSPSAMGLDVLEGERGSPTTREVRVAEPRTRRGPSRRATGRSEAYTRVWAWARVSSRQRLRPPAGVAHEQREVAAAVVGRLRRPVGHRHLGAVDGAQAPQVARRLRELHRARDRVVVGEGQRRVAALQRRRPPARRAARRRPGRRRRSGSGARRKACERMFACGGRCARSARAGGAARREQHHRGRSASGSALGSRVAIGAFAGLTGLRKHARRGRCFTARPLKTPPATPARRPRSAPSRRARVARRTTYARARQSPRTRHTRPGRASRRRRGGCPRACATSDAAELDAVEAHRARRCRSGARRRRRCARGRRPTASRRRRRAAAIVTALPNVDRAGMADLLRKAPARRRLSGSVRSRCGLLDVGARPARSAPTAARRPAAGGWAGRATRDRCRSSSP